MIELFSRNLGMSWMSSTHLAKPGHTFETNSFPRAPSTSWRWSTKMARSRVRSPGQT